ncbi:hypothetical protein HMPREF9997_00361 [Corynebacterium durum F0235]|uniref:Uncharacterized protein n=1 Tax=Corynebacterium durum F0235 TaxID=1035195 RepID=L1MMB3_9CORY|nr:hypothetical protein HMPREF9997_00361 [Corynebacterium durum F0235]
MAVLSLRWLGLRVNAAGVTQKIYPYRRHAGSDIRSITCTIPT